MFSTQVVLARTPVAAFPRLAAERDLAVPVGVYISLLDGATPTRCDFGRSRGSR
jgi:hypothetical protein